MNSFLRFPWYILLALALAHCTSTRPEDFPALYEEAVDPDEGAEFAKIVTGLRQLQEAKGPSQKGFHNKVHGCVSGEFQILPDRPQSVREGLFKETKNYSTVMRFTNGAQQEKADHHLDVRGLGVKLFNVSGEKLLNAEAEAMTQDFVMNNMVANSARTPREFLDFIQAINSGTWASLGFFSTHWSFARSLIRHSSHVVDNLVAERFWSGVAFKLGDKAMKYNIQSCGPASTGTFSEEDPDYLSRDLTRYVAQNGMCWTFGVQLQVDPVKTPIEDGTVEWTEALTPTIPVARIIIPKQDITDPKVMEACRTLTYTPWHATEDQRPLGAFNRVRRPTYASAHKISHGGHVPVEPTKFPVKLLVP